VEYAQLQMRNGVEQLIDQVTPGLVDRIAVDPAAHDQLIAVLEVAVVEAETLLKEAVLTARNSGRTWTQIATALGVSRQEAHLRFTASTANAFPSPNPHLVEGKPVEMANLGALQVGSQRRLRDQKIHTGELAEVLNDLGRYGWKITSAAPNATYSAADVSIELTDQRFEYEISRLGRRRAMEAQGWNLVRGTGGMGYVVYFRAVPGEVDFGGSAGLLGTHEARAGLG
jgi:hypothetical protein